MKFFFKILSLIYSILVDLKNLLYERRILKQIKVRPLVISVGNITMGGTGKTPVVDWLVKYFTSKGLKLAVISRAYKAQAKLPIQVNSQLPNAAAIFGDEACLLSQLNPGQDFYSGKNKSEIALFADSHASYDVMIIDDGFQHRKMYRNFDFVLIDATEDFQNYNLLPLGRARESFKSLSRAQLVIISKSNLIEEKSLQAILSKIPDRIPVVCFSAKIEKLERINSSELESVDAWVGKPVFLASGIGRPELFHKMLESSGLEVRGTYWFSDHHQYSEKDVEQIIKKANGIPIVVTEKDAVKLLKIWPHAVKLWSAHLKVEPVKGKDELDAIISKISSL